MFQPELVNEGIPIRGLSGIKYRVNIDENNAVSLHYSNERLIIYARAPMPIYR
jgi:hypothetical protein